ncbi:MAG: carbohydrate-binding domain-containing protein [Clostridiales bacterium]|nr:MAG: carbohydrate-binding domain-containing protein [Clostridiales bacterium]
MKINSSDDAIHTNSGNVLIKGGTLDLTTLDDGIHADELVKIDGGEITVNGSYEGIEGAYVEIGGGTIYITASDDGINAASDDESVNEHIIISGGTITVDASGDGLDSNGTIYVSGGTLIVYGPTTGADTGLDADGGILIDGGNVFVASSKEMLEIPASNSKSNVLVYGVNAVPAGSEIILTNADGGEMVRITLKKQAQAIILSTPELATNGTYSLYADENLLASFSVTETITAIGVRSNGRQGGNPPAPRN